jgi:hypothetical protein
MCGIRCLHTSLAITHFFVSVPYMICSSSG